jgi:hypothetical protein
MKKFQVAFKEKLQEAENLQESKVLSDFRSIYNAMLENYNIKTIHELDDESQLSFLTELSHYWSEEEGLSEKGIKFLQKRSMVLNENSTSAQKKNFLKAKISAVINETLRQAELKWRIYDVIDEAYNQLNADDIKGVLAPAAITQIVTESLTEAANKLSSTINTELSESVKPEPKKFVVKVKAKQVNG